MSHEAAPPPPVAEDKAFADVLLEVEVDVDVEEVEVAEADAPPVPPCGVSTSDGEHAESAAHHAMTTHAAHARVGDSGTLRA